MKCIAIDTSSEACSVAIEVSRQHYTKTLVESKTHSQKILILIDELMQQAKITFSELDAIAFGQGPGSFTGLRIAASVCQAIAYAHHLPVIPVSSLLAMAQTAYRQYGVSHSLIALDARMQDVYFAECKLNTTHQLMEWIIPECLMSINALSAWLDMNNEKMTQATLVGNGWSLIPKTAAIKNDVFFHSIYPEAISIVDFAVKLFKQGQTVTPEKAVPVYLRDMQY